MPKSAGKVAWNVLQGLSIAAVLGTVTMLSGHSTEIARHDEKIKACAKDTSELKSDLKELISTVDGKVDKLGEKMDTLNTYLMQQTLPRDR